MKNLYKMSAAISIFLIIVVGFTYTELGLGQLGIFLVSMFQLAPRVSRINSKVYKIEGYLPHVKRLQKFIESAGESEEDINGSEINSIEDIEFNDVSFSYTSGEEALDKINFELSRGELIALVGHSGAGKSTIASLIPRMYEPSSGEILSGGKDIRKYGLSEWREKIAVVRQSPYIFDKTLEENIKISRPNVGRKEFEEACETAQVKEFSDDLPDGIDSDIGEDGIKLSGGQRQRVAIARALLKDPDILVLDEATSDLDSELERKIYKAVKSKGDKFGVIAITHRLSTVRDADRIYTMKNGEIVETGEHQELIDLEGNYFKLHRGEK
jgi:subfamily B ATP-binding cassette protein MsbA